MHLEDWLNEEVEQRAEGHLQVTYVPRWKRIALLLWKNGGTFKLPICARGLAPHKRMHGVETMELFEFKAVIFGASMYSDIWEMKYIPMIEDYFKVLDKRQQKTINQIKLN